MSNKKKSDPKTYVPRRSLAGKKGQDSHKAVLKSMSVLSIGTLTSRILGCVRDILFASLLGTKIAGDAFFVAFKIPNLFRDLVGEGAINAAVVPVMGEYKEKRGEQAFWRLVNVVLVLALIILSVITLIGIILAPYIVRLIAPGFMVDPEKLAMTIRLTRLMFPYLLFIGMTAYSVGILFTFRSFTVPAFSPCLLNIAIILSAVFSYNRLEEPVFGLAIGVLIGGILQLAVQIRPLMKVGVRFKMPKTLFHPGARKIFTLLIPRMMGSGVYQLTVLMDTFCASLSMIVGVGGISAIYFSNRIIQLPMGVFSVAMASAVLPSLSGLAHKKDIPSIRKMIVFSLENIFFVMCPTTMILLLLSTPIIRVLFERGQFDYYSTTITSGALSFYAIGLFSFGGIKILVTAFHALQDTKTPVKIAAFCLTINAILNFTLMFPLKVAGIALASAISGTIDFLILFYIMDKRLGGFNAGLLGYFLRVALAAAITGVIEYLAWSHIQFTHEAVKLGVIGGVGIIIYLIVSYILRVEQARRIVDFCLRPFR